MTGIGRSYLVCAAPRCGGRLLATSLRATDAVMPPEPRFWHGWRGHDPWTRQALRRNPSSPAAACAYARIRATGTGADGGFGANIRWPELDRLLEALRAMPSPAPPEGLDPAASLGAGSEHELLGRFLPGVRYIHLTREDKAAQAVDWWRARHARDCGARQSRRGPGPPGPRAGSGVEIDPHVIGQLERRLRDDEWRWVAFFARAGVEPLVVSYEALTEDHAATVGRVLEFLDVPDASSVRVSAPRGVTAGRADQAHVDYARWRRRRAAGTVHDADAPVSIVITGHDPDDDLGAAAAAVRATVPADIEIVVVDDRSVPACPGNGRRPIHGRRADRSEVAGALVVRPPAPTGPASARNAGAGRAGGDVLVFLDARARPRPGWLPPLREALAGRSVAVAGPAILDVDGPGPAGFGQTWRDALLRPRRIEHRPPAPEPVPFVPSCCMAFRRAEFESVGGFDAGMVAAGAGDAEICLHLWRRGRLCLVVPASEVAREPSPARDDGDDDLYDALRLATMHFGPDTLLRTFEQATARDTFPDVYARLVNSDVFERRREVLAGSTFDDLAFLARFGVEVLR